MNAAFGSQMISDHKCSSFKWAVQGYSFTTEIRTLPLDCCDLLLGVQWLVTLGPIMWDFSNLRMEFTVRDKKHVLRGVSPATFKVIKGRSLNKLILRSPQIALLHIQELPPASLSVSANYSSISNISVSGDVQQNDASLWTY